MRALAARLKHEWYQYIKLSGSLPAPSAGGTYEEHMRTLTHQTKSGPSMADSSIHRADQFKVRKYQKNTRQHHQKIVLTTSRTKDLLQATRCRHYRAGYIRVVAS